MQVYRSAGSACCIYSMPEKTSMTILEKCAVLHNGYWWRVTARRLLGKIVKPYYLCTKDPPSMESSFYWFNSYQEVFTFNVVCVNDRTLLITKCCIQIQLSPSAWDDVREDVATIEGWLHWDDPFVNTDKKNSQCSKFQLLRPVPSSYYVCIASIGKWQTWFYWVCFHINLSCHVMQLHKSIGCDDLLYRCLAYLLASVSTLS